MSKQFKEALIIAETYLPALGLCLELTKRGIHSSVQGTKPVREEETLYVMEKEGYFVFSWQVTKKKLSLYAEKEEVVAFIDEILKELPLDFQDLTPREEKLVQGILEGLTNREIASRMYLSEKTIRNNLTGLYKKLNIKKREDLMRRFNG